ncbi:hypothetical protein L798_05020 [Zootermopsis nevadensis]|uniref:Uncharacterized protein n=1 Tax=Zootermopsis nevadensis TaxID=136037 RepID=A0A067RAF6_ZOONE|nr:hypothetical protein L798_05020 [Zootermopsis nevadensis]
MIETGCSSSKSSLSGLSADSDILPSLAFGVVSDFVDVLVSAGILMQEDLEDVSSTNCRNNSSSSFANTDSGVANDTDGLFITGVPGKNIGQLISALDFLGAEGNFIGDKDG